MKNLSLENLIQVNENFDKLIEVIKEVSTTKNSKLRIDNVQNGIKLSSEMFDKRGNKSSGWSISEKRGGRDYISPTKGYIGHGLNVWGKYDGGNNDWLAKDNNPNEWCVGYHGTNLQFLQSILENKLKPGLCQAHQHDEDINHPGEKVGIGVYCVQDIIEAEQYSREFYGYKCVIMCRINPKTVRIPKNSPQNMVVNGKDNEIRPYRILIKKC